LRPWQSPRHTLCVIASQCEHWRGNLRTASEHLSLRGRLRPWQSPRHTLCVIASQCEHWRGNLLFNACTVQRISFRILIALGLVPSSVIARSEATWQSPHPSEHLSLRASANTGVAISALRQNACHCEERSDVAIRSPRPKGAFPSPGGKVARRQAGRMRNSGDNPIPPKIYQTYFEGTTREQACQILQTVRSPPAFLISPSVRTGAASPRGKRF